MKIKHLKGETPKKKNVTNSKKKNKVNSTFVKLWKQKNGSCKKSQSRVNNKRRLNQLNLSAEAMGGHRSMPNNKNITKHERFNYLRIEKEISEQDSDCMIVDITKELFNINENGVIVLDDDTTIIDEIRSDVEESFKENNLIEINKSVNANLENIHILDTTEDVENNMSTVCNYYIDEKPGLCINVPYYDNLAQAKSDHKEVTNNEITIHEIEDVEINDDNVIFCGEYIELDNTPRSNKNNKNSTISNDCQSKTLDHLTVQNKSKLQYKIDRAESNLTSNTYNPNKIKQTSGKRMVIIDGSNIAYAHSNNKYFSVEGLSICLRFFEKQGHDVKAVVPQSRLRRDMTNNQALLNSLKEEGKIMLTPSKNLPGNSSSSYDDRFILQVATEFDAAIISNDNYRDLLNENPKWKQIIESRVVGYSWFHDMFMVPKDPYGKHGPSLQQILNF